jgi:hypothetical protein
VTQHDFIIADGLGLAVREDLQAAVQALASLNSGPVAPFTVVGENDAYTKIMLHFDGPDASTTITDNAVGGSAHTWTAAGNAQIDTADGKFGNSSLLLDGTGDYLSTPDHADFALGANDFTIECWFKTNSSGTSEYLWGQSDSSGTVTTISTRCARAISGVITAQAYQGGSLVSVVGTTIFTNATNPGWHHVAYTRNGNTLRLFIDGVQEGGDVAIAGAINDSANSFRVGAPGDIVANLWNGWIDEFRLSVGSARWTAAFTPPEIAYGGGAPYAGMFWLDTTVAPNGQLKMRNQANTAWISVAGFPAKASSAETVTGTDDAKYVTPAGVAARDAVAQPGHRNHIVNPAMQISQQNGNTASTVSGYFPADQWQFVMVAAGADVTAARVASITPGGSLYRFRLSVTTALAALGGSDFCSFHQPLEGTKISDFMFGTASAKRVILRFGFKAPAGTYAVALRGISPYPAYTTPITITAGQANTDTVQTLVIPGNPAGSWLTTNARSMELYISIATGAAHNTASNVWTPATGAIGVPGATNGLASTSNVFELFDVGLYLDDDVSGIPPLWEMPDPAEELLACQRYVVSGVTTLFHGTALSGQQYSSMAYLPVEMRANPTLLASAVGETPALFPNAVGSVSVYNTKTIYETRAASTTGPSGFFTSTLMLSARM